MKGYEFRKDQYLLLTDDDFDSMKVESSSIDPVYYDAAYFLTPDGEAGLDVYAVLPDAIAKTGKIALSGSVSV